MDSSSNARRAREPYLIQVSGVNRLFDLQPVLSVPLHSMLSDIERCQDDRIFLKKIATAVFNDLEMLHVSPAKPAQNMHNFSMHTCRRRSRML